MARKEQPESCRVYGSVAANARLTEPVTRAVLTRLVAPSAWTPADVAVPTSSSALCPSAQPRLKEGLRGRRHPGNTPVSHWAWGWLGSSLALTFFHLPAELLENHSSSARKWLVSTESCRNLFWRLIVCSRGRIPPVLVLLQLLVLPVCGLSEEISRVFSLGLNLWISSLRLSALPGPWKLLLEDLLPLLSLLWTLSSFSASTQCSHPSPRESPQAGTLVHPMRPPLHLWEERRETWGQFGMALRAALTGAEHSIWWLSRNREVNPICLNELGCKA